jgi:hypothetical protein
VEYVMVPVPQDLEERVQQYLAQRLASGSPAGWSDESLVALYEQLDEASRVVLEMTARGVGDDEPVTVGRIARAVRATTREILGIVVELAQSLRSLGGPAIPVLVLDPPQGGQDGDRPVTMPSDGARVVLSIADRT